MSLLEQLIPYEILYYFVATWLTIPQIHTVKQLNFFFNYLVTDVLQSKKYNKAFISSQLKLLEPERKKVLKKITLVDIEIVNAQKQMNDLDHVLQNLQQLKLKLISQQENLTRFSSMFIERSFGKPNVWMVARQGFFKLRGLEQPSKFILKYSVNEYSELEHYNLSFVLTKKKTRTWFWIHRKNTDAELQFIDHSLTQLGWIKFFPLKSEQDFVFVYIHPDEPFLNHIHRTRFYNCPICKSQIHSKYKCPMRCPMISCKSCFKKGHTTKKCYYRRNKN